MRDRTAVPPRHRVVLRFVVAFGLAGFGLVAWGLIGLDPWPTALAATLVPVAQLWRIDRFGRVWERVSTEDLSATG